MRSGRTGFCGFLALVLAATLAPAAEAYEKHDACPDVETFRPFSQWGDESDYVGIPGGSFDDETLWTASGAAGVVEATTRSRSGAPAPARPCSTAATRSRPRASASIGGIRTCGSSRGRAREVEAQDGRDMVDGRATTRRRCSRSTRPLADAAWGPSKIVTLSGALPRREEIREVRVRFPDEKAEGEWLVDDLFVDPNKRG